MTQKRTRWFPPFSAFLSDWRAYYPIALLYNRWALPERLTRDLIGSFLAGRIPPFSGCRGKETAANHKKGVGGDYFLDAVSGSRYYQITLNEARLVESSSPLLRQQQQKMNRIFIISAKR